MLFRFPHYDEGSIHTHQTPPRKGARIVAVALFHNHCFSYFVVSFPVYSRSRDACSLACFHVYLLFVSFFFFLSLPIRTASLSPYSNCLLFCLRLCAIPPPVPPLAAHRPHRQNLHCGTTFDWCTHSIPGSTFGTAWVTQPPGETPRCDGRDSRYPSTARKQAGKRASYGRTTHNTNGTPAPTFFPSASHQYLICLLQPAHPIRRGICNRATRRTQAVSVGRRGG